MARSDYVIIHLWRPDNYGMPDDIIAIRVGEEIKIPEGFDRYRAVGTIAHEEQAKGV